MTSFHPDTLLGYVPFKIFSESRLCEIFKYCKPLYVSKGRVLMEPGRTQSQAYFLMSGKVKFEKSGETITPEFSYALHYKYQKQDTLVALTDCSLFQIESDILDRFVCWSQVSNYIKQDISYQRQYDDQADWMRTLLQSNLFYKVSPLNLQKIFSFLSPVSVKEGQKIITQGEPGDCCFFIKEGIARVTRSVDDKANPMLLAEMHVGQCVGEDALLHEATRNATVTMLSDGLLMRMDKRDFLQLLREPVVDTLTSSDLDMALQTGAVLLDVRTEEEYAYQHLTGALCMPLDLLRIKARLLDSYKLYVTYCDSDRRGKAAAYLLEQQGIRARALLGGLAIMPVEQKRTLVSGA